MKVFEFEARPESRAPEFSLGGEEFVCRGEDAVPSIDVLGYVAGLTGGDGLAKIKAIVDVFGAFLPDDDAHAVEATNETPAHVVPSSAQRFRNVLREKRVPLSTVAEIASYVLDEYLSFPTREAGSPASPGSSPVARLSVAVSSEPESASSS